MADKTSPIYEAEASATVRAQGDMLDIHEENGQLALKAAGLFDKFLRIIRPGSQQGRALDKDGNVLLDDPNDGRASAPKDWWLENACRIAAFRLRQSPYLSANTIPIREQVKDSVEFVRLVWEEIERSFRGGEP